MNAPAIPKARILIAEDVNIIALIMARALEKAGYKVDLAHDGEECLRKALEAVPDLILLDIMMPKMSGIEVLKALRADPRTRNVAVVMCTAKDFKTERDATAELGALDYFIKPSVPEMLVEKVGAVLARSNRDVAKSSTTARTAAVEAYQPVLDTTRAHFTLWGTRGSTPTPGGAFRGTAETPHACLSPAGTSFLSSTPAAVSATWAWRSWLTRSANCTSSSLTRTGTTFRASRSSSPPMFPALRSSSTAPSASARTLRQSFGPA